MFQKSVIDSLPRLLLFPNRNGIRSAIKSDQVKTDSVTTTPSARPVGKPHPHPHNPLWQQDSTPFPEDTNLPNWVVKAVNSPRAIIAERQTTNRSGLPPRAGKERFVGYLLTSGPVRPPSGRELLEFVDAIHESLELEKIGANYMQTITSLVSANAYGFYLFNPESDDLVRVAVQGGVERYVRRYEQFGYKYDPLFQHLADEHHPVCETQLFTEQEWQQQPLRKALTMRRLVRMMEAPIVTESSPVGTLFFTRRPDQPPFIEADMRITRTISRHVTAAVKNALNHQRTREQQSAAEGVLQVIGSALILTDSMGDIRFANKQAEEFLAFCGDMGAQRDRLRRALRDNVNQLFNAGISTAVSVVPAAPSRLGSAAGSILLRSVRVPGSDGTVATFICSQSSGGLQMEHLTGLLPQRALEVLELVAEGHANKEIARRLFVSENTVKYHLKRLFQTFGAVSRSDLLAKALAYRPGETAPLLPSDTQERIII